MAKVVQTAFYCDCCLRKLELAALHHTMLLSINGVPHVDKEIDICKTCLANRLSHQITAKLPQTCNFCSGRGKLKGKMLESGPNNGDYVWAVDKCQECWCHEDCPRIIPENW